jgi:hypothetical protein
MLKPHLPTQDNEKVSNFDLSVSWTLFCWKFFRRFFQKATADPTRGALVAAHGETSLTACSFLPSFFLCASGLKEKSGQTI